MASPSRTTTPELFAPLHVIGVDTPIGRVFLESDGQLITRVSFETLTGSRAKQPALLGTAAKQMEQYFKGKRSPSSKGNECAKEKERCERDTRLQSTSKKQE